MVPGPYIFQKIPCFKFWVSTMSKIKFQLSCSWPLARKTRGPPQIIVNTLWQVLWLYDEQISGDAQRKPGNYTQWKEVKESTSAGPGRMEDFLRERERAKEGEKVLPGQPHLLWLWNAKRKRVGVTKSWDLWIRQNCLIRQIISPLSAQFLYL